MKQMKFVLAIFIALALAAPALAWSPKMEVKEDVWMQVGFLGQAWFEAVEDGAGTNDEWSKDFYFRRARILGMGSVHKNVKFFFDTDVPNSGKEGFDNDLILNDAFIDLQIMPAFKVQIGRILVPFSVENKASAALLLGIDYNTNVTKLPLNFIDKAFWRDDGVEVRGILLDGLIDYRVGLFDGEDDTARNLDDDLRTTGMVMINLGDAQPGWFYNMNSLGSLNVLSFSAGYDYIGNSEVKDGKAWNVGVHLEQPLGNGRIVGSATFYDYDGPNYGFEGQAASAQAGYLMPCSFNEGSHIQPVLRWQHQDNDNTDRKIDSFGIGLNYFLKGHNINFKAEYTINDRFNTATGDRVDAFRFQTQLLF